APSPCPLRTTPTPTASTAPPASRPATRCTRPGASAPRSSRRRRRATTRSCGNPSTASRAKTGCASPRASARGRDAPPSSALPAMLDFATALTSDPREGDRAAIEALRHAGLGDAAVVALAQLVAFLSYQLRVVAGLQAMRASANEAAR